MLERLSKYGAFNAYDLLKVIALVTMTVDHVGAYLYPDMLWLRAVGRLSAPVWFFLVGYAGVTRVDTRLLWGLVILMAANLWCYYPFFPLNVLVSVIICRLVLRVEKRWRWMERQPVVMAILLFLLNVPLSLFWEYGTVAVMLAFCGRMVREGMHALQHKAFWIMTVATYLVWQAHMFAFSEPQLAFVTFGVIAVAAGLSQFEMQHYRWRMPRLVEGCVLLLSRYSLEYYVLHRAGLQAVGAYGLVNHAHLFRLFYD